MTKFKVGHRYRITAEGGSIEGLVARDWFGSLFMEWAGVKHYLPDLPVGFTVEEVYLPLPTKFGAVVRSGGGLSEGCVLVHHGGDRWVSTYGGYTYHDSDIKAVEILSEGVDL